MLSLLDNTSVDVAFKYADRASPHSRMRRSATRVDRRSRPSNKRISSYNGTRTVETLVVVDRHLSEAHDKKNVTTYVLSILNVVRA